MWAFLGIVLSAAWLGLVYLWFERSFGLENLPYLLPGEIGQFLAGVAAPLALIWVIVGFLRTGSRLGRLSQTVADLADSVAALPRGPLAAEPLPLPREPGEEAGRGAVAPLLAHPPAGRPSPVAVAAAEPADGKVTPLPQEPGRLSEDEGPRVGPVGDAADELLAPEFRQLVQRTARDLNAICMDLSAVLCRKAARDDALKSYNRGDKEVFHLLVRDHLSRHEPAEVMKRLAAADALSLLHTYAVKFAGLLDEAQRRDPSGAQEAALRRTAMGQLYEEVLRHTSLARS